MGNVQEWLDAMTPEKRAQYERFRDAQKNLPKWDPKAGLEAEKRGLMAGKKAEVTNG